MKFPGASEVQSSPNWKPDGYIWIADALDAIRSKMLAKSGVKGTETFEGASTIDFHAYHQKMKEVGGVDSVPTGGRLTNEARELAGSARAYLLEWSMAEENDRQLHNLARQNWSDVAEKIRQMIFSGNLELVALSHEHGILDAGDEFKTPAKLDQVLEWGRVTVGTFECFVFLKTTDFENLLDEMTDVGALQERHQILPSATEVLEIDCTGIKPEKIEAWKNLGGATRTKYRECHNISKELKLSPAMSGHKKAERFLPVIEKIEGKAPRGYSTDTIRKELARFFVNW